MILDSGAVDPRLGVFLCAIIRAFYSERGTDFVDTQVRVHSGVAPTNSEFVPATTGYPRFYACTLDDYGLIVIDGCESVAMGVGWMLGYQTIPGSFPQVARNGVADGFVDAYRNRRSVQSALRRPKLVLCGHSLGGSIAAAFIGERLNQFEKQNTKLVQFGSPKTGILSWAETCLLVDVARWMNVNDPVAITPPTIYQAPLMSILFQPPINQLFGTFVHLHGGISLSPDGGMIAAEYPRVADVDLTMNYGAWLYSMMADTDHAHNLGNYQERLGRASALVELGNPLADPEPIPGVPVIVPRQRIAAVQDETQAIANRVAALQQEIAENLDSENRFRAVKIDRLWFVQFGKNSIISCGPRRKRAGLLAQAGNLFLARLLREGAVDAIALGNQLVEWLARASDPSSTIKPTIRRRLTS